MTLLLSTLRTLSAAATQGRWHASNGVGGRRHVTQGAGFDAMGIATFFGEDDAAFAAAAVNQVRAMLADDDTAVLRSSPETVADARERDRMTALLLLEHIGVEGGWRHPACPVCEHLPDRSADVGLIAVALAIRAEGVRG